MSTGSRINGPYETLERGNQANVWVTESDGVTPLLGEVRSSKDNPDYGIITVIFTTFGIENQLLFIKLTELNDFLDVWFW